MEFNDNVQRVVVPSSASQDLDIPFIDSFSRNLSTILSSPSGPTCHCWAPKLLQKKSLEPHRHQLRCSARLGIMQSAVNWPTLFTAG